MLLRSQRLSAVCSMSLCSRGLLVQRSLVNFILSFGVLLVTGCKDKPEVIFVLPVIGAVEETVSGVNSGTVKAEQLAELAFGAVGRVREVNVHLGERVPKAMILAQIENGDLKSKLDVAAEELARAKTLEKSQAASRSNVIQAQGNYDAAVTAYDKSLIRAPFEGIVAEKNLEVGQLSQITAVIPLAPIRLIDTQPRYVRVEIDEVDLPKVKLDMVARVKVLAVRREPFKAVVRKVIPFVSTVREQDRTSEVELDVDSEGILLPAGASADVEIVTATKSGVVVVPSRSILGRGASRYVFTIASAGLSSAKVMKVPVAVGLSGYNVTEIISGLSLNDRVIMPAEKIDLRDGLQVRVKAE
jgi:HlyD family secretion protein